MLCVEEIWSKVAFAIVLPCVAAAPFFNILISVSVYAERVNSIYRWNRIIFYRFFYALFLSRQAILIAFPLESLLKSKKKKRKVLEINGPFI